MSVTTYGQETGHYGQETGHYGQETGLKEETRLNSFPHHLKKYFFPPSIQVF